MLIVSVSFRFLVCHFVLCRFACRVRAFLHENRLLSQWREKG